ncbi:MAG: NDP-sugar synthase, partial [Chloroflexi bacterium]|nr:NDP-sugar synthase [Chloroflexota bacterium]
ILALCYLPDRIEKYFGDGHRFGIRLTYVTEPQPLGTAGAVRNADGHFDDTFLVFNGDIFTDVDLKKMLAFHHERKAKATIGLTKVEDPTAYGLVETEADGRVKRFLEKPKWADIPPGMRGTGFYINAGIYVVDRDIVQEIPPCTHFMFERDLFPGLLAKAAPMYGYRSSGYWIDIGTPEKYLQVHCDLLEGKGTTALFDRGAVIGTGQLRAGSSVDPAASIEGPVALGNACKIGAGVRIRGPAAIGDHCTILDGAVVERAVLWRNVHVGKHAVLRDCIIGDHCRIGDGMSIGHGSVLGDYVIVNRESQAGS